MPPLPKKKHSKGRKGKRAAHHGLKRLHPSSCPQCGSAVRPHRACTRCGIYNGRMAAPVKAAEVE